MTQSVDVGLDPLGRIIKGTPQRMFTGTRRANGLSDVVVDCRGFNAASIQVLVFGAPGATLTMEGAPDTGTEFTVLSDPNATKTAINTSQIVDVVVGQSFLKVRLAGGTYSSTAGYIITVTPYIAAGPTSLTVLSASSDIATWGGTATTLGLKAMAASVPVVLASDQSPLVLTTGAAIIGRVGTDQTTPGTTDHVSPIAGQNGVAGNTGLVGATTQRVVLATDVGLPAGSAIVGRVGTDQTTPGTTDHVSPIAGQNGVQGGAGASTATTQRVAIATDANVVDTELPAAASLGDAIANPTTPTVGAAQLGFGGATFERLRVANIFKDVPATAVVAGTPLTVWTPAAGKKFRLMGWALSDSVAGSLIFKYGAADTLMFRTPAVAAAGNHTSPPIGNGSMPGAANDVLKVDVTANGTVAGVVWGTEE